MCIGFRFRSAPEAAGVTVPNPLRRHEVEKRGGGGAHNWGRDEVDQL